MKYDKILVWRIKQLQGTEHLVEDYRVAVDLSNGPDPDRCKFWEQRAVTARRKIRMYLAEHPVPEPTKKKKEKEKD
jgi:hypothetical protein